MVGWAGMVKENGQKSTKEDVKTKLKVTAEVAHM